MKDMLGNSSEPVEVDRSSQLPYVPPRKGKKREDRFMEDLVTKLSDVLPPEAVVVEDKERIELPASKQELDYYRAIELGFPPESAARMSGYTPR